MNKPTHVIFDFDGVVADTEGVFTDFDCRLINDVLAQHGTSERVDVAEIRMLAGNPGETKLDIISERLALDLSSYRDAFIKTRTQERLTLFRDTPAALGKNLMPFLAHAEGRIALATNKTSVKLFHDMDLMGLRDLFPVIVPCDPPLRKKPAPDILLEAAKQLGAAPEMCIYIGDNTLDMQAAKAAGMMACGFVIEGKAGHDARITALHDHGADIICDDFMNLTDCLEMV